LTICPQVDKGSEHMWREEQREVSQPAGGDTVPGRLLELSSTRIATKTARRPLVISKAHLRAIRQRELLRDRVTALLRYCGSRNRVAALLRLRSAPWFSLSLSALLARLARTVSSRFPPPPRLSYPVRYRTCVVMYTACLCKGGFVVGAHKAARHLPSFVCLPPSRSIGWPCGAQRSVLRSLHP
jgi:hypothetical protein